MTSFLSSIAEWMRGKKPGNTNIQGPSKPVDCGGLRAKPCISSTSDASSDSGVTGLMNAHVTFQDDASELTDNGFDPLFDIGQDDLYSPQFRPLPRVSTMPIKFNPSSVPPPREHFHRKREPQKFSGQGDWKDYLRQFRAVAKWNSWDEPRMGLQLAMSLTGEALEVWSSLTDDECYDYATLVSVLGHRFSPCGQESQFSLELMKRACRQNESMTTFWHALRRLASRAYPGQIVQDEILVNLYINGLPNDEIKRHVYFARNKTLSDAINCAASYETFGQPIGTDCPIRAHKPKPVAVVRDTTDTLDTNNTTGQKDSELSKVLSNMTETMRKLASSVNNMNRNQGHRGHYNPGRFQQTGNRDNRRRDGAECFNCHEIGHFARDCKFFSENRTVPTQPIPSQPNGIPTTTEQPPLNYTWLSLRPKGQPTVEWGRLSM